jgi:hypothetical protein
MPGRAVILGFDCPAHGHRVKIASGVAARSASLNPDPAPAHQGLAPARTTHQTSKAQMAVTARWLRDDRQGRTPVFCAEEFVLLTYCP